MALLENVWGAGKQSVEREREALLQCAAEGCGEGSGIQAWDWGGGSTQRSLALGL
jgi:hypothetical protein